MIARPGRVFADTSFLFACLDSRDVHHERAQEVTDRALTGGWVLYTTWDVVSETVTLLRTRAGFQAAMSFLDVVKPTLRLVEYSSGLRSEAEQVFRQYARGRRLSFCDAISFVVVTTLLERAPCLAFDDDFRALGLSVIT